MSKNRLQTEFLEPPDGSKVKDGQDDTVIGINNWDFNADGDISILDFQIFRAAVPLWLEFQARQGHAAMVGFNPSVDSDNTSGRELGDRLELFDGLKGNYAIGKPLHYAKKLTFNNIHTTVNDFTFSSANVTENDIKAYAQKLLDKELITFENNPWSIANSETNLNDTPLIYPLNSSFDDGTSTSTITNWYTIKGYSGGRKAWNNIGAIKSGLKHRKLDHHDLIREILQKCYLFSIARTGTTYQIQKAVLLDYNFFKSQEESNSASYYPLIKDSYFENATSIKSATIKFSFLYNYIKSFSPQQHTYTENKNTKQTQYEFWDLVSYEDPENRTAEQLDNLNPITDGSDLSRFDGRIIVGEKKKSGQTYTEEDLTNDRLLKVKYYYSFLEKLKLVSKLEDPSEFDVIKQIAVPQKNSSYIVTQANTDLFDIAIDENGKAMHFHRKDVEYFEANTERSLVPNNQSLFLGLCDFIKEHAPAKNPFSNPVNQDVIIPAGITPGTIDYGSKAAADLMHAMLTNNRAYIHFLYGINTQVPNAPNYFSPAQLNPLFSQGGMTLGDEIREYSLRKIIDPPVFKLISCTGSDIYYVQASPVYEYSITGIYNLASLGEDAKAQEKDQDFFPITDDKHTYYLYAMTHQEVKNDYTTRQQLCHPGCPDYLSKSWNEISGKVINSYLYPLLPTGIPEGCYTFYRVEYDPARPYNHLPNRWDDLEPQNCGDPRCLPPPPTPPPSNSNKPTPSITPTPEPSKTSFPSTTPTPTNTRTPSITPTSSETPTPTNTPTPSTSPSPSISDSQTQTPTPTKSLTPSPSISHSNTQTPTPTRSLTPPPSPTYPSQSPTPSITATPSRTVTPTPSATPSTTLTATPTRTATRTPSVTPTNTRTQTPSRTPSPTKSPTPTPSPTQTPSKTGTPTATQTRTPTPTPSNTRTPTPTPSTTRTPTPTPSATRTPTPSKSGPRTGCRIIFESELDALGNIIDSDYPDPSANCPT